MKKFIKKKGVGMPPVKKILLIMRLSVLLILISVLYSSASVYSQNTRLNLNINNQRIADVFDAIEQQSEFYFFYNRDNFDDNRRVSLKCREKKIDEVLDKLFNDEPVSYEIFDRNILIKAVDDKSVAADQQKTVKGKITDRGGQPLPGVTVVEKGTTNGTVTDIDGNYSISHLGEDAVIQFSFVGMRMQEINVAGRSVIDVVLEQETIGLDEVVAVGYGTQKKMNLTGAVSQVTADELITQAVTSAAQAIQGRATGVEVIRNNGAPGAEATIRIRGLGTFGNTEPLVLIDGIEGNINNVSSSEIESVNILKDASSCAIYGTRAANGVIIVTTKKGKSGESKIQYNFSSGFSQAQRVPKVLNAKEFVILQNEAAVNNGLPAYYTYEEMAAMGEGTDWIDAILQTGHRNSHNLMFSGGTDKLRYALNGDFLDEKGIVMNSWYKRYNVRLNLDTDVTDWLTIGLNAFGSYSKQHETPNSGENTLLCYAAQYTPTISPKVGGMEGTGGPTHGLPSTQSWWGMDPVTYSDFLSVNRNYNPKYRLISSFFAEFKLMEGLTFKTTWGINKYFSNNKVFNPSYQYYDSLGKEGGGDIVAERLPKDRSLSIRTWDNHSYTITNLLTYTKTFNDVHNLTVLVGHNDQKYENSYYSASVANFSSNSYQYLSLGTEQQAVSEAATHWALRSYFGRLNYDYKGKYLFEFSMRRDASSKFSEKNRWGTFPSASFGWRISDESFMAMYDWIDDMKIRASYGILGNQELGVVNWDTAARISNDFQVAPTTSTVGLYESYSTMNLNSGYAFNNTDIAGAGATKYANPDIKWEEAHMANLGLDMTLFDGAFVVNAEYYNKKTKDLILDVNLPMSVGFYDGANSTYLGNAGEMKNSGFEYTLHYFNRKGDFKFDIRYSGSHNHNEITKLQGGSEGYWLNSQFTTMHKVGEPYGSLGGMKIIGIYQNQAEIDQALQTITERGPVGPGDYIFEDANGDKVINTADAVIQGHTLPTYIMGLTANASYKGFDFNMHVQGDLDKQTVTRVRARFDFSYYHYLNNYDYLLERWHGPGTSDTQARVVLGNAINGGASLSNTQFIQPASYIRIRNVELGYTIPSNVIKKIGLKRVRVYCNVANLATFTKYVGFEVERTGSHQRMDLYPQSRTISLGANITL